ncbi:MAG: cytochrome C biogenesis protein [Acidimicrobiaceae bacterium]|nr:cytochrome c biogenesis protein CcsA [Acidimicrobiaceae bacterium]MXW60371.1 cytochrome C biogenesis protein [Acidimicrobiaceae bacterium]MYA74552.1 cytochrome C biogenesis protein [Acidimicrobiaceae bacterium]MYC43160.1 cytochrome C biogenesis protein [Acidimicrobiaceae bacterium]MYG54207.1 cytochrome C biogenesis protein [Acidimicrobiaceae bacterium]
MSADAVNTGSRTTRLLGAAVLIGVLALILLGFFGAPEDDEQRDAVRMIFVHLPSAFGIYAAMATTAVGSVMWLWKRSRWWDIVAHSSAEIGVIFCGLTLFTGSVWGRPTWNTYWDWGDVRLVTTLILFLMLVGYLALRSAGGDENAMATRAAVVGLLAAVNVPIINRSVEWWSNRTLHQKSSLTDGNLEDLTLFTLFVGIVVWALFFVWAMIHRFRIGWLEHQLRDIDLETALIQRRAEAATESSGEESR